MSGQVTSCAEHDDRHINDIWAIRSGSGVSWSQFPLQGKPLKGSYFQAAQPWRAASSRGSGFDAAAL